ncbi:MAG: RNA recognition motif domain-containing protein [Bacteroidota bacterium]
MNIYVGNLSKDVTEQDLERAFSNYGGVKSIKIIRDIFSGESKGFAFVEMNGVQQSQEAINQLNTTSIKGKKIVVNEARPRNNVRGNRPARPNSFNKSFSSGNRNRY